MKERPPPRRAVARALGHSSGTKALLRRQDAAHNSKAAGLPLPPHSSSHHAAMGRADLGERKGSRGRTDLGIAIEENYLDAAFTELPRGPSRSGNGEGEGGERVAVVARALGFRPSHRQGTIETDLPSVSCSLVSVYLNQFI
ncbi:hypothetical protein GUJ93_ZPchr0001g30964 [Zizania palustris]|uniref:Uncharacterized protein n=1 Tax=Zizania palustris TaxID=103762 RepID=A0A8J5RLW0_ZIZPA|nr:hypothetical protein GUJ93_ZPchr0001g30964 [Zizania palustris]